MNRNCRAKFSLAVFLILNALALTHIYNTHTSCRFDWNQYWESSLYGNLRSSVLWYSMLPFTFTLRPQSQQCVGTNIHSFSRAENRCNSYDAASPGCSGLIHQHKGKLKLFKDDMYSSVSISFGGNSKTVSSLEARGIYLSKVPLLWV